MPSTRLVVNRHLTRCAEHFVLELQKLDGACDACAMLVINDYSKIASKSSSKSSGALSKRSKFIAELTALRPRTTANIARKPTDKATTATPPIDRRLASWSLPTAVKSCSAANSSIFPY